MYAVTCNAVCIANASCIMVMKCSRQRERRKRDRENECTPQKTSRNNQKADGREQAVQLPVSRRVHRGLR
jgi:primase-polymerase (primpol)-like protein